jgi:hypothetical protein
VARRNVLTQIAQYAKRVVDVDVAADYEWLCNTVHPSFGTTFVYSTLPLAHVTGTHIDRVWSATPTRVVHQGTSSGPGEVESTIARSAITSLANAVTTSKAALRLIDDIALTTRAPTMYTRPLFRGLLRVNRNETCPCGSGLKAKHCIHEWGQAAPSFPDVYTVDN